MAIVLAYDISARHTEIKNYMTQQLGYQDQVSATGLNGAAGIIYLPNTTLYHGYKTNQQAYNDIESTVKSFGVILERAIAYRLSDPADGHGLMTNS